MMEVEKNYKYVEVFYFIPVEVWKIIFGFLGKDKENLVSVNKYFHRLMCQYSEIKVKPKNFLLDYEKPINYEIFNNALSQITMLRAIDFSNSHIVSDYINRNLVSTLTNLTELTLSHTHMLDEYYNSYITALSHLKSLTISSVSLKITNELQYLTNLTTLNLSNAQIENEGLSDISRLTSLTELDLSKHNSITNIIFISNLTAINVLNLSSTKIASGSLEIISKLTHLNILNVSHTCILEEELQFISKFVNLQEVYVSSLPLIQNFNSIPFSKLPALKILDISYHKFITDIEAVSSLINLEELNVSYTSIGSNIFSNIGSLTNLRDLNCSSTNVAEIPFGVNLPCNLRTINLHNTHVKDFSNILALSEIINLNLSYTSITDEDIGKIFNNLFQLKKLDLSLVQIANMDILMNISNMTNLTDLNLSSFVGLMSSNLTCLSVLTNLECLKLSRNILICDEGIMNITTLTNLRELKVVRTSVTEEMFRILPVYFPNLDR